MSDEKEQVMEMKAATACYPILVSTARLYHITDNGQRTRCGHDCRQWWDDHGRPVYNVEHCTRCGNEADFGGVNALLEVRQADNEARRQEENRQSVLRYRRQAAKRRQIVTIIADALRENGFDVEVEILPAGENTYVFAATEHGEPVAFEINVNERTEFANSLRAKRLASATS